MQKRASLNQRFNGVAAERFIKSAGQLGFLDKLQRQISSGHFGPAPSKAVTNLLHPEHIDGRKLQSLVGKGDSYTDELLAAARAGISRDQAAQEAFAANLGMSGVGAPSSMLYEPALASGLTNAGYGALGIAGAAGAAKSYQALAKRYGAAQAKKIMAGAVGGSAALGGAGYGAKKLFDAYGDDVAGYLASAGARAGALKDMLKLPSTETLGVKSLLGEELPNMLPAQLAGSALGAVGVGAGALGTAKAYQALAKRYGAARANKIMAGAVGGSAALGGAGYGAKKLFDAYGDDAMTYLKELGLKDLQFQGM